MELLLLHALPRYKLGFIVPIESIPTRGLFRRLDGIIGRDVCFRLKPDTDLLVRLLWC